MPMSRFVSIGSVMLVALAPVACGNNQQPDRIEFRQSASVQQPQTALDGATGPKYVAAVAGAHRSQVGRADPDFLEPAIERNNNPERGHGGVSATHPARIRLCEP